VDRAEEVVPHVQDVRRETFEALQSVSDAGDVVGGCSGGIVHQLKGALERQTLASLRTHQRLRDLVGRVRDGVVEAAESFMFGLAASAPMEHSDLIGCFEQEVDEVGRVHFAGGILRVRM